MSNPIDGYGSQFFDDQHVTAPDLNMVGYSNILSMRNYIKSLTNTPGVFVTGVADGALQVSTTNGQTFSVNAGTAIDPLGRVITVPVNATIASGSYGNDPEYRPELPSRSFLSTGKSTPGIYYINLKYVPMYDRLRYDDQGNPYNTRVYDSYEISVDTIRSTEGITLAHVVLDGNGYIVQDETETGYYAPASARYYSAFDDRPFFKFKDAAVNSLTIETTLNATKLAEEMTKTIGFLSPQNGHAFYGKIPRNVQFDRLELQCVGSSGNVSIHVFSGSAPDKLKVIGIIGTSPNVSTGKSDWATHYFSTNSNGTSIGIPYYAGHTICMRVVASSNSTLVDITSASISLVYTRR